MNNSNALKVLSRHRIFLGLAPKQQSDLLDAGEWLYVAEGAQLLQDGGSANGMFLVGAGRFEVWLDGTIIAGISAGESIGEMWVNSTST